MCFISNTELGLTLLLKQQNKIKKTKHSSKKDRSPSFRTGEVKFCSARAQGTNLESKVEEDVSIKSGFGCK
jgi:hypothetical protein